MASSLSSRLEKADNDTLKEILREAESRLDAQLTMALAADLRAMTLLGFMVAVVAVVVAGTLAIYKSEHVDIFFGAVGLFATFGMSVSSFYAFEAAKPIDFDAVGNYPSGWASDAESGKPLHIALAEVCAHYDEMLKSNKAAMKSSSEHLLWSSQVALGTMFVSAFLVACRILHLFPY
ncbi:MULTISPECIES: hypothetical protein [Mesorhizobium]|uniref:hypothetical protein n=1 Tax=Mesorhizobium TaxID=68287 RepID=UPI0007ECBD1F|nr:MULTISPECIES: hypothetical protein [Mesorhizobium]TPJ38329.1 hypothetical protein FJ437_30660 [Mesorhizobium sp. B2-6-6]ARP67144.1 hypothetical protein A9K65_030170 [Mesorhizobium sp. WSM1497]MCA0002718.1 hypothetical protein [Mesorhizobium sp. B264B2A]MCA0009131.1 hypothetical protein [Mesorhizobium sp. B264B1B]MCA0014472.1 hypothetical protein [Mesorhizobium sp. B294B1A1]